MTAKIIVSHFIKDYKNKNDEHVREKYGILSGVVGIIVNLILFSVEIILGIITNSIAIIADAFHNLADVTSALVTIIAFRLSNKPADKEHPFGHGRFEYISGLIVSFIILIVGIQFIETSFSRVLHPEAVKFNLVTFIIIIMAIPLKLWLSYFNKTLGKMINSETLKASGADAFNDVAILSGVIISLIVGYFAKIDIDGYVGLIVAIFIVYSGLTLIKSTISPLLGEPPDPKLVREIKTSIIKYDHIIGVHDLIIHNYGPGRCMASLHAEVPSNIPIMHLHESVDKAEKELSKKLNMFIVVHMDPICIDSKEVDDARRFIVQIIKKFPIISSIHDFRIVGKGESKNLVFDAVISFEYKVNEKQEQKLRKEIEKQVKLVHPGYDIVITFDRDYTT
ncbi:MAG: cation diffusion facilitator family transporter [Clostridium sp.]|nr:cation diffusion facilitator family transporter [Clostridium sp.]